MAQYVNQALAQFDDLRLIVGDDFTKGEFGKTVFEQFCCIPFAASRVLNDPLVGSRQEAAFTKEFGLQNTGESGGSSDTCITVEHSVEVGAS